MTASEITTLRTALAEANAEIERLRVWKEEALRALEPFGHAVRSLDMWNLSSKRGRRHDVCISYVDFTYGQLRRARALLNQKDATDGE